MPPCTSSPPHAGRASAAAPQQGPAPARPAVSLNVTPSGNDGSGAYRLTVKDVPVDGFWSVSVYDAEGHFVTNDRDAYALNSVTAIRAPDGR
jgi:hypothetical protein